MASCKYCGKSPTVKSHLLPRALALDIRSDDKHLLIGSAFKDGYKHSQAGIFDLEILCRDHEQKLNPYDTYAVEFCRTFDDQITYIDSTLFHIDNVSTDLLVRFVVSVLWRFSVSERPDIPTVALGTKFSNQFAKIIFEDAPCTPEPALLFFANRSDYFDAKKMATHPACGNLLGRRCWSFMVGGLSFVLKVDSQPMPRKLVRMPINGKTEFISAFRALDKASEMAGISKIVKRMAK